MPSKKSIVFELNNTLRVYAISDSVNYELELLCEIEREGKVLGLATKFEFLWQDLDETSLFEGINEIYFLIGPHAGFTDTRMIFMWLKSWEMFGSETRFYLKKVGFDVTIDLLDIKILIETLNQAKREENDTNINYSKEPKIGKEVQK